MGRFLPGDRLLAFDKCMDGRRLVSEIDFRSNTNFGIRAHKFLLECTVTAKVECNVAHTLRYHLVG